MITFIGDMQIHSCFSHRTWIVSHRSLHLLLQISSMTSVNKIASYYHLELLFQWPHCLDSINAAIILWIYSFIDFSSRMPSLQVDIFPVYLGKIYSLQSNSRNDLLRHDPSRWTLTIGKCQLKNPSYYMNLTPYDQVGRVKNIIDLVIGIYFICLPVLNFSHHLIIFT